MGSIGITTAVKDTRRIGGLEIKRPASAKVRCDTRRIGGLEMYMIRLATLIADTRRIGGLEK